MKIKDNQTIIANSSVSYWLTDALMEIQMRRDALSPFEMRKMQNRLAGMLILLEPSPNFSAAFVGALAVEPTDSALQCAHFATLEIFGASELEWHEIVRS